MIHTTLIVEESKLGGEEGIVKAWILINMTSEHCV